MPLVVVLCALRSPFFLFLPHPSLAFFWQRLVLPFLVSSRSLSILELDPAYKFFTLCFHVTRAPPHIYVTTLKMRLRRHETEMFFVFSSFLYRYTVLARESDAIGIRWYGIYCEPGSYWPR